MTQISTSQTITSNTVSSSSELNLYSQMGTSIGSALIGVIFMILLLGWIVKRLGHNKKRNAYIHVKATHCISPKERIILVEVDKQLLVVGITSHHMTLLHTIDEQRAEKLLSQSISVEKSMDNNRFKQVLQSALKSKKE
ncbi:flagellar biosynthetic protein FliO [Gilliamella sp. ESL0441]|uniref:flagellar biosynthetic protein FliO n=1 Tax=Gilliamella sp. ESL0441 TaxID=2704654 RepID=UPI001C6A6AEE|nr:flagellar biosynthetic protein FliO [Gilliamella sp. ESL0441]QYN45482.1 flagellar biosynthetic protein FliO [Gilliamella sp. ESL0441]